MIDLITSEIKKSMIEIRKSSEAITAEHTVRLANYTKWLAWITFIVVICNMILVYMTWKIAADAEKDDHEQQRAYLAITDEGDRKNWSRNPPFTVVQIKNTGLTPANGIQYKFKAVILAHFFDKGIYGEQLGGITSHSYDALTKDEYINIRISMREAGSDSEIKAFLSGQAKLLIVGEVAYDTVFGKSEPRHYCSIDDIDGLTGVSTIEACEKDDKHG